MNLRYSLVVFALLQFILFHITPIGVIETEVLLFQIACFALTVFAAIYFWQPVPTANSWR